jgi:hypothetical protein
LDRPTGQYLRFVDALGASAHVDGLLETMCSMRCLSASLADNNDHVESNRKRVMRSRLSKLETLIGGVETYVIVCEAQSPIFRQLVARALPTSLSLREFTAPRDWPTDAELLFLLVAIDHSVHRTGGVIYNAHGDRDVAIMFIVLATLHRHQLRCKGVKDLIWSGGDTYAFFPKIMFEIKSAGIQAAQTLATSTGPPRRTFTILDPAFADFGLDTGFAGLMTGFATVAGALVLPLDDAPCAGDLAAGLGTGFGRGLAGFTATTGTFASPLDDAAPGTGGLTGCDAACGGCVAGVDGAPLDVLSDPVDEVESESAI